MDAITHIVDQGDEIPSEIAQNIGSLLGRKPRVLIYTTLFPNSAQPVHGNFILERMKHLMPYIDMSVVAPVPYFPRANIRKHWFKFATVPATERLGGFQIDHPRYLVIPKVGMATHGISMLAGSVRQVWKQLNTADYDLIDAHYVYPDGLAATMLGALFRKPVVVSARGSDINLFSRFRTIRPMVRRVLKQADKVVAVTAALKNVMVELGCPAEKIAVVGNGVDAVKFRPLPGSQARQRLGLPSDRPIVLSVGNLNENKGFHILIDAVMRLRIRRPDILLIIVGEGKYRTRLESQIHELGLEGNVRLAGAMSHQHLPDWYGSADVFCLGSLIEGCPNVVLEAMACGCPVVATRAGGIPDLISSSSLGVLVDRTAAAFEAAIGDALRNNWDRPAIVDQARAHSWDRVTAGLLTLYSEVLTARRRSASSNF